LRVDSRLIFHDCQNTKYGYLCACNWSRSSADRATAF
jgi:hypothetical protein